jgi:two-component system response regulator GlrR
MQTSSASTAAAGSRLLIVDDDVSLLDAMQRALRDPLRAVTACDSFEKARQLLKDQVFDALITDVRLGAFNGLQLAVMAKDMHPGIRVIVFSGFDDPVLRADAEQIGAAYLVKPVASSELVKLLESKPAERN